MLAFVARRASAGDPPPTVREIGEAAGLASTSGASFHRDWLVDAGLLERTDDGSRGLRVTEKGRRALGITSPRDVLTVARQHLDDLPAPVRAAVEACEVAA